MQIVGDKSNLLEERSEGDYVPYIYIYVCIYIYIYIYIYSFPYKEVSLPLFLSCGLFSRKYRGDRTSFVTDSQLFLEYYGASSDIQFIKIS